MAQSPTSRSLDLLRRSGYIAAPVERWIAQAGVRKDLWSFGDIIAAHAIRREILLVQVTTLSNVSSRVTKAKAQPELACWLQAGGLFTVHGWFCSGGRWDLRQIPVSLEDLQGTVARAFRRSRVRKAQQPELFEDQGA
jgi:hypothetical protein